MSTVTKTEVGIVDAVVHPSFPKDDDIVQYLPEAYQLRGFPGQTRYYYSRLEGEFHESAYLEDQRAGSDRQRVEEVIFAECGVGVAILLPLTRGLMADRRLGSAICTATNSWLSEEWLSGEPNRFRGSIRVDPDDVEGALAEIERWADDPRMVQIAVPLEALHPYGQPVYFPIWAAAAKNGLPVAVQSDGGAGVDYAPTGTGYPRHYIEFASLQSLRFFYHLASLITEGVFDRLPELRFVFADGGADVLPPLMWRLDSAWRQARSQSPENRHVPSSYLAENVWFATSRLEGPTSHGLEKEWADTMRTYDHLLYGSHYPHWSFEPPDDRAMRTAPEERRRVLGGHATTLYRLSM
jgi:predicted TIM-barrel fold metal-dependent hydrolase